MVDPLLSVGAVKLPSMNSAPLTGYPIVLVPGFWLGGWAWEGVADRLRAAGHTVQAVTLPGLESAITDRSKITIEDHVEAIRATVESMGQSVVLAVHSGAGVPGYAVTDRVPDRIATMVYVDSGPAIGALDPGFEGEEQLSPRIDDLDQNLDGLSEQQLLEFVRRALPEPGGAIREGVELRNPERLGVPSLMICCAFSAAQLQAALDEGAGWLAGLKELRDVRWIDLPTSHWPMWSEPEKLAEILSDASHGMYAK
ncbi:alpha/beta fold hydrolase [Hamadaea tsunoensis]|uniref:alpha/beta fold hydrolase n=1 Tax=Hamadaea tsunoensis TaxID=53368 RepID=UPI0009FFC100|nr:alpha/beta hydrolase [Hamadaea tsunoensis]